MQFKPPSQPCWGQPEPDQQPFPEWQQQPSMYMPVPPVYARPETYYPPVQPMQTPLPRKEMNRATLYLFISVISVVFILGAGYIYQSYVSPVSTPSSQSSQSTGTWTTTHTFSGNGIKQTAIFTVSNDWMLQWTCDPASFPGSEYYVGVYIYNADGTLAGVAVNTICKAGNTGDSTELHQGGDIYLSINSSAAWSLTIQELQ